MFLLFNFSSIFPGGQLTPFAPMCGRPWTEEQNQEQRWFEIKTNVVVVAACRPLVLRMSLTSYGLNADSGRYTDTLMH